MLEKAPSHSISQGKVIAFLTKEFPHHDAHAQFKILVRLGFYGEVFAFDQKHKHLSLF